VSRWKPTNARLMWDIIGNFPKRLFEIVSE
jgi:hypothetical protein